jgi:phage regulator Rha-like protein
MNIPVLSPDFNGQPLTMSSREIAELLEKRHDDVKRSVKRLAERGVIVQPPTADEQDTDALGRKRTTSVYRLEKRDSYVVVAQLSPEFTARLVDRWDELEKLVRQNSSTEQRRQMLRQDGKAIRKDFTNSLRDHGCKKPHHFMNCSKVVAKAATGMTPKQIREARGVKNARDGMTSVELMSVGLMEALAEQNMDDASSDGFAECYQETKRATHSVAIALNANATAPRLEASK